MFHDFQLKIRKIRRTED